MFVLTSQMSTTMDFETALSDPIPAVVTYFFLSVLFGWTSFVLSWNFGFQNTCNTGYSAIKRILRWQFRISKCMLKSIWKTILGLFVEEPRATKVVVVKEDLAVNIVANSKPEEISATISSTREVADQSELPSIGGALLIGCAVALVTAVVVPWLSIFT